MSSAPNPGQAKPKRKLSLPRFFRPSSVAPANQGLNGQSSGADDASVLNAAAAVVGISPPRHVEAGQSDEPTGAAAVFDTEKAQRQFEKQLSQLEEKINVLPTKENMDHKQRITTAAICVIRALESLPPAYYPPTHVRLFTLLHNPYYRMILQALVLFHIALAFLEPPPRLYGASSAALVDAGYFARWKSITIDVVITMTYNVHCLLLLWLEIGGRGKSIRGSWRGLIRGTATEGLLVVVCLLNLDMIINLASDDIRPFRFLRPLVYTFMSVQQTMMIKCCLYTLQPLMKTFLLLLIGVCFYSVLGLNLFYGTATLDGDSSGNIFGAACWVQSGERHPFDNFGYSVVTMYVLATTDNHPSVMWPFFTCSCQFNPSINFQLVGNGTEVPTTSENVTSFTWLTNDHCNSRKSVSLAFFVSYMAVVFFCLGNSILAVCYYWFERVMKKSVIVAGLQQRFSLITAFYYLESGGRVGKQDFLECADVIRQITPGHPGTLESDQLFFHFLDRDGSNELSLSEFFKIGELMRSSVDFHRQQYKLSCYGSWKRSLLRYYLQIIVTFEIYGIVVLDAIMTMVVLVNGVLASLGSTRDGVQNSYANLTTFVFVAEIVIKVGAMGIKDFWNDLWNRFDFWVTLASVAGLLLDQLVTSNSFFSLVQCLRLLRLVKLLTLLQRVSNHSQQGNHGKDTRAKDGFFKQLLDSLATTIPVCVNVMLLLFFFLYAFAVAGMELLYDLDANSKVEGVSAGSIDFVHNQKFQLDWADVGSALLSVFTINVGNNWADVMYNAEEAKGNFAIFIFFIGMHFMGVFLLLNIIQSLFVFTFSTLMSRRDFKMTVEYQVRQQLEKIYKVSAESFKRMRRPPRLEFLLLSWDDLDREYTKWLKAAAQTRGEIDFGSAVLRVPPLGSFLFQDTQRHSKTHQRVHRTDSVTHNQNVEAFLRDDLKALPATPHGGRRPASTRLDNPILPDQGNTGFGRWLSPRRITRAITNPQVVASPPVSQRKARMQTDDPSVAPKDKSTTAVTSQSGNHLAVNPQIFERLDHDVPQQQQQQQPTDNTQKRRRHKSSKPKDQDHQN